TGLKLLASPAITLNRDGNHCGLVRGPNNRFLPTVWGLRRRELESRCSAPLKSSIACPYQEFCREGAMGRYVWVCIGVAMAGASSYLIFGKPEGLPLWLVWLGGSFLGYMGIAV